MIFKHYIWKRFVLFYVGHFKPIQYIAVFYQKYTFCHWYLLLFLCVHQLSENYYKYFAQRLLGSLRDEAQIESTSFLGKGMTLTV